MIVTKDWIMANRTIDGGWTKEQLKILGLEEPLKKGWMDEVSGIVLCKASKKKLKAVFLNA